MVRDEKRPWVLRAREAAIQIENTTVHEEDLSLPQTLIYISYGWESFKEDFLSLLANKEWHLQKAHGFNFFPGTQSIGDIFPTVSLTFAGGATMVLRAEDYPIQQNSIVQQLRMKAVTKILLECC